LENGLIDMSLPRITVPISKSQGIAFRNKADAANAKKWIAKGELVKLPSKVVAESQGKVDKKKGGKKAEAAPAASTA